MQSDRYFVRPRAALVFSAISIAAAIVVPLAERWPGILAVVLGVVLALALAGPRHESPGRRQPLALGLLMLVHVGFWLAFGQLSRVVFEVAGWEASRVSLEISIVVPLVMLAPLVSGVWGVLARYRLEPSTAAKFSLGFVLLAVSWFFLGVGIEWSPAPGPSLGLLVACVLALVVAALCLGPASLTAVSELGLREHRGTWLSVWLLGYLFARASGGWTGSSTVAALVESCAFVGLGCVVAGVGLAFAWRPITSAAVAVASRQATEDEVRLSLSPGLKEAAL